MNTKVCTSCKAQLDSSSRFCKHCGTPVHDLAGPSLNEGGNTSSSGLAARGNLVSFNHEQEKHITSEQDSTLIRGDEVYDYILAPQPYSAEEQHIDQLPTSPLDSDTDTGFLPILGGFKQSPYSNTPTVQGTPQIGNVPSVHGTPYGVVSGSGQTTLRGPASNQAPSGSSLKTEQHHPLSPQSPQNALPSSRPQPPILSPYPPKGTLQAHHSSKRRELQGKHHRAKRWGGVGLAVIVVITAIIAALLYFIHPVLSGNATVTPGGVLHLRGSGFIPGGSAFLSLDKDLPLSYIDHSTGRGEQYAEGAFSVTALRSIATNQLAVSETRNNIIPINIDGTFEATIVVNPGWSFGSHTILASETIGITLRSAVLEFKIVPTPTLLVASPNSFNIPGDTSCPYNASQGWTCTVLLSSSVHSQGSLDWSASSSGVSGIIFTPAQGVLSPGQSRYVNIFIPSNTLCPSKAKFTFSGSGNTVELPWSCAAPELMATADAKSLSAGCVSCTVILTVAKGSEGGLSWSASANTLPGVMFIPSRGNVFPGHSVQVTVKVPNTTCPPKASFTFQGPGNTAQVIWSCATPNLSVSPAQFARTDCSFSTGWTCMASLENRDTLHALNWSASSDLLGVTFTPQNGTIQPGSTVSVNIVVPGTACPTGADFFLKGPRNTVHVPWSCTPAQLNAGPATINVPTPNCSYGSIGHVVGAVTNITGNGWRCRAFVKNADSQISLPWSASANGATITPQAGSLSPGQTVWVNITIPDQVCPVAFTFNFKGPTKVIPIRWSCATPNLTVSPNSFGVYNNGDCPYDPPTDTYTCTVILSSDITNQGGLNWSMSLASNMYGITFDLQSGVLYPGYQNKVNITVSASASSCSNPDGSTLSYTPSSTNPTNLIWSCV